MRGSSAPGVGAGGVKLAGSCSIPLLVHLDESLTFGQQVAHLLVLIKHPLVVQAKVQQSVLGLIHRYRQHNCLRRSNSHLLGVQRVTRVVAERSVLQLIFKNVAEGGDGSTFCINFGISTRKATGGSTYLAVKKFAVKDVKTMVCHSRQPSEGSE
jgi:hypothetical protein